jgi:hypothetical protein
MARRGFWQRMDGEWGIADLERERESWSGGRQDGEIPLSLLFLFVLGFRVVAG